MNSNAVKNILMLLALIFAVFAFTSCDGGNSSTDDAKVADDGSSSTDDAKAACEALNGTIETYTDETGTEVEVCRYVYHGVFDDGTQVFEMECRIEHLLKGACEDGSGEDAEYELEPPVETCPTCLKTVRQMYNEQVDDILLKLDNTGYRHFPFDLHPNYTVLDEVNKNILSYNLFLDCSGFVGYYVIQGLTEQLYSKLPKCYGAKTRPLAADFADHFAAAVAYDEKEATSEDIENNNLCWSRIEHIKDALPGDVIVYKHSENITKKGECDYEVNGNTGHVLFIHGYPYRSTEKKDANKNYQWVVQVADSTNVIHMFDSRKKRKRDNYVFNQSVYGANNYTAWSMGRNKKHEVERCKNGTYHRSCRDFDEHNEKSIEIVASHKYDPTGIGTGKMYINDKMDGYRAIYSHKTQSADVYIGRPVPCNLR